MGYRLSKHKMTKCSKNWGAWPPGTPGYAYAWNLSQHYAAMLNVISTVLAPPMRVHFASTTYLSLCSFKVTALAPSMLILFHYCRKHCAVYMLSAVASGKASGARPPHLKSVPPHFTFGPPVAAYIQYCILKMWPPLLVFGPPSAISCRRACICSYSFMYLCVTG